MSVIVKGGGGKSSGLYVWAKYNADIGLGESINNIALANDGTSIDIYVKENLYIMEDGTIVVQGEPYSTVSISSVVEDTCIGGMTPTKYCIGVDGNVYSSPLSHIAGSVDNCLANLVKVVKSTFIDFVVSDSPTAYPDGGEQGGYWYERMKEGITPEMFGCTKMAIDTVTYSSDQSGDRWDGLRINHTLGTVPKFSILLANGNVPEIKNYIKFSITTFPNANRGGSLSIGYSEYNGWCSEGFTSVSADQQPTPTDTYAEFKPGSMFLGFLYLKAGIEYTLITMA